MVNIFHYFLDCRTWGKGFRKIGEFAYICLPKLQGRQRVYHCPSRYFIPEWYSMGLTEPCSCINVPYRGTMKKICPSPPLRGSYGKDLFSLPSVKLEKFAAVARYRGQWSDPRDFLRNGFKQRQFDDRDWLRHRVVRIGHTVLRRPTAPTPFAAKNTAPANVVSTPQAIEHGNHMGPSQTTDLSNQGQPNPATTFAAVTQLSSLFSNEFAVNQFRSPSSYSLHGKSQIKPNGFIQNNPATATRFEQRAIQRNPFDQIVPHLQQRVPVDPSPTYLPRESGTSEQPATDRNDQKRDRVYKVEVNRNGQNARQQPRELTQGQNSQQQPKDALQQLQEELSMNWQNQPNTYDKLNASLLLPDHTSPKFIDQLQRQQEISDSNSQPFTQFSQTQPNLAQVPNQTPIPVPPTFVPGLDNSSMVSFEEDSNPSSQNTEPTDSDSSLFDTSSSNEDSLQLHNWNETTRQEVQESLSQLPLEQLVEAKERQMPVVIHTSTGRIVRIDPRYMDIAALMKVFHQNQNTKILAKEVLVKSNGNRGFNPRESVNSEETAQDISSIGDARRMTFSKNCNPLSILLIIV